MSEAQILNSPQHLYARVWRWHFFAAMIVIPFVLWQSATGVLYLWHRELAVWAHPEQLRVTSDPGDANYEQQLANVLAHHPRERLNAIEISDDPTHSTAFFFRDDNGLSYPAFTNPHTGEYLGAVPSTHWLRGLSRGLHGGWPINPFGSYLLELGASWAIVMTLTGLYLWWPRNAHGPAGALYPRLRSGPRVFWRDLHATVGVYFALILLVFLVSALPWTTLWGEKVLGAIETATHQKSPRAFFFEGGTDHHHAAAPGAATQDRSGHSAHAVSGHALSLDEMIDKARAAGARGLIELQPRFDGSPVNVRDDHPRGSEEIWMQLDSHSGAVRTRVTWEDLPPLARFVALGIDLHEGRFFGLANQIFNTLFAAALVWLSVTGFIGWYRRRPHGGLAAPPKRELRYPIAVITTGVLLCVTLPLLGVSVLGIALIDRIAGRFLPVST